MSGPTAGLRRRGIAVARTGGAVVGLSLLAAVLAGATSRSEVQPPPANVGFDFQLGGAYAAPSGAGVVERDRTAAPAPGRYGVCYVNAFQTQQTETAWWRRVHPQLLLRAGGHEVRDPDWPETLLDVSTPDRRRAVVAVVGRWMAGCAQRGYRAVELDNLDSWTRSHGLLTRGDAVATARLLVRRGHDEGLAVGQKNAAELLHGARRPAAFDFAVVEECQAFHECGAFTAAYGDRVFEVEYDRARFRAACAARGARISIVLRDLDLRPRGASGYRYASC